MRIGIIAEGRGDLAVITNILKGQLNINRSDLDYLQPELEYDETDLHQMSPEQFSNWGLVKNTCCDYTKINEYLESFSDDRYIIIHIDSAECELEGYDVTRPQKNKNYSHELRERIISRIHKWQKNSPSYTMLQQENIFYAVAIEETEAWLLTIYTEKTKDTSSSTDPKKELQKVLNRTLSGKDRKILQRKAFEQNDELSKPFRKKKNLIKYAQCNESLRTFYESLFTIRGE